MSFRDDDEDLRNYVSGLESEVERLEAELVR
jgi:uncharacterized small protein (DUF1192 family)